MWLWGTAITAGTGFWSAHFIALLSYRPGLPTGYDPVLTLLAWLATILGMVISLGLLANATTWRGRFAGGAALGLAQSATHFVGIAAFRTEGLLVWNTLGAVLAHLSPIVILALGVSLSQGLDTWRKRTFGAALITLSILVLHFSGMASMSILPDARVVLSADLITPVALCIALVIIISLSVSMSIMALLMREHGDVEALHRLREVISAMPAGLAFFDSSDRMVVWNASYADMAGVGGALFRPGMSFREFMEDRARSGEHPEAIGREAEWVQHRVDRHRVAGLSFEQKTPAGWLRIDERRTSDGGVICVAVDVTDLKRSAASLAAALDETERANKAKDQFLANMSHEVRTPLNGVLGLADALANAGLTPAQQQIVDSLQTSALALSHMLTSVIDVVSLNSGRFELHAASFDLQAMLRDALTGFTGAAHAKGLALTLVDRIDAEMRPIGDRSRIQQVLVSLIDNAIKFTARGEVRVEVDAIVQDGVDQLAICVIDTGVGFARDEAAALFETFAQADGSMTRRHGGAGVGLSLSHKLACLMSGDLTANSVLGQGSTFRFTLPVVWNRQAASPLYPIAEPQTDRGAPRRLRVLLADDHPTNREIVGLILSTIDAQLTAVEDGAQAVEAFKLDDFDMVLMDLQMPIMDGLTAMRHIRAWEVEKRMLRTPMMALTANVLPNDVVDSLAAGATLHLGKPVTAIKLLGAMDAATRKETQYEARLAG